MGLVCKISFERALYAKFPLKGLCIQNLFWKSIVYKISMEGRCIQNFLWNGVVYKNLFERTLNTKFYLKGHSIQKNSFKGRYKIFFDSELYSKFSFKECCIQHFPLKGVAPLQLHTNNCFDRVLHAKFSFTGRFIQHFLWKGVVYNIIFEWFVVYKIFFERALYTIFSLKGFCIQIIIASAFVWKKIYVCPFSRCL